MLILLAGCFGNAAEVTSEFPVSASIGDADGRSVGRVQDEVVEVVEELPLSEVFRRPVGPRGLEYSDKAVALAGKRVRLTGFPVRQTAPIPFAVLLAPFPIVLHEREYGLAEDLPGNTVHVLFARGPVPLPPPSRGPVTLEGILELGAREEADGRVSHVRLRVLSPWRPDLWEETPSAAALELPADPPAAP